MTFKVTAVAMVKDEADIICSTVTHMLSQVDEVIVADNRSTDGTRNLLHNIAGNLIVVDDPDVAYYQSEKMTRLARMAYERGARWVIPFDADELWCSRWGTLREVLAAADADYGLVTAELYDHVATAVDPSGGDALDRLPWRRREPLALPKVAVRADPHMVIEQGNHWARLPIPPRHPAAPSITIHHYPYRTVEQMVRKVRNGAAAYEATEGLDPAIGAHWRGWAGFSDDEIRDLFHAWYWRADPDVAYVDPSGATQDPLILDDPPRVRACGA